MIHVYCHSTASSSSSSDSIDTDEHLNIEDSLLGMLLPFQVEGIRFVVRHKGRALIGDEMGCGKVCIL